MAANGKRHERWKFAAWVFVLAFAFRLAIGLYALESFLADPDAYRAIAETVSEHGVFGLTGQDSVARPTAFRPPLYPWLLSFFVGSDGLGAPPVAILHAILGGAAVAMTWLAVWRWSGRVAASNVAALVVAVDPILCQQSTAVMTETLATTLVAAAVWWWSFREPASNEAGNNEAGNDEAASNEAGNNEPADFRLNGTIDWTWIFVGGGLLSLAYLCRPTFLVWSILMIAGILVGRAPWRIRLAQAAIVGAMVLGTVGAWTLRNAAAIGHPVWATTHGGYTLLLGNNPMFYAYLRQPRSERQPVWDPQSFIDAYAHRYQDDPRTAAFWNRRWSAGYAELPPEGATEVSDDRLTYQAARATIDRDGDTFARACGYRLVSLWTPFPNLTPDRNQAAATLVGLYYVVFYGVAIAGALAWCRYEPTSFRSRLWPAITIVLTLSMVHAVYWSNMRMRAPAIPALAVVVGGVWLGRKDEGND